MEIKEILEKNQIMTMKEHPRKCCTLYPHCIICHPDDKEMIVEGLKAFFVTRDKQKCSGKKFFFVPSSLID